MFRTLFNGRIATQSTCLLILMVLLAASGCKKEEATLVKEQPVKPVKLMTISSASDRVKVSLPGRVRAAKRSELSFKVSGPLERLPAEEGQIVKKGELVAQILSRDFQTSVNEAKARYLEAEQQFTRYKELFSRSQVSRADYDQYRASRDVAKAQLEDAQNALKDTRLLAPFDGVISKRMVENFEKVQVNQPIANLQHIDQLEVLIDVPELTMNRFTQDNKVNITVEFDAVPGIQHPLKIKEFSTEADPATRTYQVVLVMDQPKGVLILPGMTAKVKVIENGASTSEGNITIPAVSVMNNSAQKSHVWLLDQASMTVTKQPLQFSALIGSDSIKVSKGLQGGDEIVIAGVTKMREGMKVRRWENQRQGK